MLYHLTSEGDFPRKVLDCLQLHQVVTQTSLCQKLQVSATKINAAMTWLQSVGVTIEVDEFEQSYQLQSVLSLCDPQALVKATDVPVYYAQTMPSTNSFLQMRSKIWTGNALCVAEHQTQGRGRRAGRGWYGCFGQHISFSISQTIQCQPRQCSGLSLWVGLMVVQALENLGYHGVALKWPNDLYYQQAKLGGILVEMQPSLQSKHIELVIGVGINLQPMSVRAPYEQDVAHLEALSSAARHPKYEIIAACWHEVNQDIHAFLERGLQPYLDEWHARDMLRNQVVRIKIKKAKKCWEPTKALMLRAESRLSIVSNVWLIRMPR